MHASPYVLHDHQISFQVWPSANTRLGGCCSHLDPGLDGALIGLHTTVVMISSFAPAATHHLAPLLIWLPEVLWFERCSVYKNDVNYLYGS